MERRGGYGGKPVPVSASANRGGARGTRGGRNTGGRGHHDGVAGGGRGSGGGNSQHYRAWDRPVDQQSTIVDGIRTDQIAPNSSSGQSGRGGGSLNTRGGRGGGRGCWGPIRTDAAPVQPEKEDETNVVDSVVSATKSLTISGNSPLPSPPENELVPMKRPDNGGRNNITSIKLRVNHFLLNYNPESIIRHYDIDIKPDYPSQNGLPVKVPKAVLSIIRNKLFSDDPKQFPLSMTAYDGEKNIFSIVSLPTGTFKVKLPREEGLRIRSFVCELKLVNEIKCDKLSAYFTGKNLSVPRDVLQAFDVVMKENPSRQMFHVNGSFHPVIPYQGDYLGFGITASRGIKHSLKPTSQGLALCMDYSVLPLIKQMRVLDFLKEHIHGFNLNNFSDLIRRQVEKVLKGLNVTVTHRTTNQKFKIARLTTESTQDSFFDIEDKNGDLPPRRVRLVDYFREKYGKDIQYKHLPCLDLGKNKKKNYVPMEFCIIAGGQKFPKERLDRYPAETLRKISLASPKAREGTIYDMLHSQIGPCGGDISVNFGINADMDMTTVTGRVIVPPVLKLGDSRGRCVNAQLDKDKCDWNLKRNQVVSSIPIRVWGVLDFAGNIDLNTFIPDLIARCQRLNIRMDNPRCVVNPPQNILGDTDRLRQMLEDIKKRSGDELQILICILPRQDNGYNNLKLVCETKLGIRTQCCLSANASKTNRDQFLANIALKINAKIGGSNVELLNQPRCLQNKGRVMFVGADVNHPGALNATSPSIAAVSASMNWPAANKYSAKIDFQHHRTEKIMKFGSMCMELVNTYAKQNQGRPDTIVVFRDGVSGNQFDMVLNEELKDLKMTFAAQNYSPNVTVIIAQKRHTTRLFLDSDKDQNVSPGTVVDTKIVDPFGYDFYLCSHYGQLGTSKPAHYHVLQDQNKFTSDQIQELIYSMCFTSARCTKPVSLVPPVMYADLAAYRGRLYYNAMEPDQSSSSSSTSTMPSFDENLYKLHPNLENSMFFI